MRDVQAIALGVLQISLEDASRLSVNDITRAWAWRRMEQRQYMEMTRLLAYYIVQPYDSKNKIKQPDDLFKLPWEQSDQAQYFTEEAKEARRKRFAEWDRIAKEKANGAI